MFTFSYPRRTKDVTETGHGDASIISIRADGAKFLALEGAVLQEGRDPPKPRVIRVGFHKDLKLPSTVDIVFLEFDRKPSLPADTCEIPEIEPLAAGTERLNIKGNVAGTAMSGRVNGKGLQYERHFYLSR